VINSLSLHLIEPGRNCWSSVAVIFLFIRRVLVFSVFVGMIVVCGAFLGTIVVCCVIVIFGIDGDSLISIMMSVVGVFVG